MAIPAKGEKIDREIVIATHPEYGERNASYRLYRHCYEGSGGFAPKLKRIDKAGQEATAREYLAALRQDEEIETYLVPHEREHAEDFKDRLEQAHAPNMIKHRGVMPLTGFLCDQEPERKNHPPEFEKWQDNATVDGEGFATWQSEEGIPYGITYGSLPGIIDSDPHTADTKAEQENQGADTAKLRVIHPENICDWRLGRGGCYESIKYKTEVETAKLMEPSMPATRYVFVTPEGWLWVDDSEDTRKQAQLVVGGSGMWPWVGKDLPQRAPIVELRFNKGLSDLHDIAPLWKRFFNQLSEMGSLQRNQRPVFYMPEDDAPEQPQSAVAVGEHNYVGVPLGASCEPGFASPDPTCLQFYLELIKLYPEWVQEMFGTASIFGAVTEAAAAMAYRFTVTEKKLHKMAASIGRFELDCAEVVGLWHGKRVPDTISTEYTASFDAVAVERLLEQLSRLTQDLGSLPPTALMLAQKRAFFAVMPDIDEKDKDNLDKEWELGVETQTMADETEPDPDSPEPDTVPTPGGDVAGNVGGE